MLFRWLTVLRKLKFSVQEHRKVEEETLRLLSEFLPLKYIRQDFMLPRGLVYVQKNIFSILFLSIYNSLGIPEERRLIYGIINHSIRGLVTAADNILDDEYKEMLPFDLPEKGKKFKSIMHILLFDRFLFKTVDNAVGEKIFKAKDAWAIQKAILAAMVPIGEEEAGEEGGVEEIMTPEDILSKVHKHKGGDLLRLAFAAPRLLEKEMSEKVKAADDGVYKIGMALQIIDDLVDLYEDVDARKHNYLVSSVFHRGDDKEKAELKKIMHSVAIVRPPVEAVFPATVKQVADYAIGEALEGFSLLHGAGFWLDAKGAETLIRKLFILRGAQGLLSLISKQT